MKEEPKGIKEYLDYCFEKYYRPLLEKYSFQITDQQISGMGALYSFQNDRLKLTIVNDMTSV
ncbi:hypothetical protein [Pontibacter sp. SGAir0037]|uniref:hypothetical protein n=1 Tax=Pontibacter sp. SGAir0037 TaxID=2571030 RepID=UPI0010CD4345|nr:hypothetical protein [Pontibacter sp. SGAir0037]QCR22442.1 hypothetical protein C1N53_08900 [Pontibacter sp. SGAir0037]